MNRKICQFILISIFILSFLTTCGNPWMEAIAEDLLHNNDDFGRGAGITTINIEGWELSYTLRNDLTEPGNYVINVSSRRSSDPSISIPEEIEISGDITVSLRGNGGKYVFNNSITVSDNAKLILRDITLDAGFEVKDNGTLVMESGSAITMSAKGESAVIVETDGTFIMNGGIIYGINSVEHSVIITGPNARFDKTRGGMIFGNDAPEGFRNFSDNGHVLCIIPSSGDLYYRDTTIRTNETLSVSMDSTGDVLRWSGNWDDDTVIDDPDPSDPDPDPTDPDLSGEISISPNFTVAVGRELTAVYTGSENVTYQWNKDGTAVNGATSQTYTPTEAGSYTVTVSAVGYNPKTSAAVEVITEDAITIIYNNQDFGEDAVIIEVLTVDLSDDSDYTLEDVFDQISLLGPGNYVIDVSGDAEFEQHPFFDLHNTDVTISLRGNGGTVLTVGGNYTNFAPILLYSGNTLILRDITLKQDNSTTYHPIINVSGGTLIMEEGSVITAEVECWQGVIVNNGGSFIMKDGEIRGLETSSSTVTISGEGSSFEKTGGVIYGAASGINGNTPDTGYLVEVLEYEYDPVVGYHVGTLLYYRSSSTDLTGPLSVIMNEDGSGVKDISPGWSSE